MTAPMPDNDDFLDRLEAELREIESLPPAAIELPANQSLAIISLVQACACLPNLDHNPLRLKAIAAGKQIQSSFHPESAIY